MSYSQKTTFLFFPNFCVKWSLDHPTRNQTLKYGFLATFWVAPSHPTKFQPNPSPAGNTLLDTIEKPFLSNRVITRIALYPAPAAHRRRPPTRSWPPPPRRWCWRGCDGTLFNQLNEMKSLEKVLDFLQHSISVLRELDECF